MNDRMTVGPDTRFSDIYQQFQTTGRGGDKHIRFQDAKGLYLSQKVSMAKISDLISGSNRRMQARMAKRAEGAEKIKQAIDHEYGQGYGDRIFRRVNEQHGIQLGQGVRRADLELIREAIDGEGFKAPHFRQVGGPAPGPYDRQNDSLETVLNHPEGFWDFHDFCKGEFSTENPEFWSHVEAWKRMPEGDLFMQTEKEVLARWIVDQFVREDSPQQVNLAAANREALLQAAGGHDLAAINISLERAQQEIRDVMGKDSFRRFKFQGR